MKRPDLLGKTLQVTKKQIPYVYEIVQRIARLLDMDPVDVFIFEDFYYGAESKGADRFWIEVSAKTITDFTEKELTFLLAKEMCSIKLNHTYYFTLVNELLEFVGGNLPIPGADSLEKYWKGVMYKWCRIANYSTDNFGYLVCGDLTESVSAILKLVLNSPFLVKQVCVSQYIKQADEINVLDDLVYNFTKLDEMVPYGPFRIKNLISFSSSENSLKTLKLFAND